MKRITGRTATIHLEDRRTVGNEDCILGEESKQFLDIVKDYVHAVRAYENVTGEIRKDTIYICPSHLGININATNIIDIPFDSTTIPNPYETDALFDHMKASEEEPIEYGLLKGVITGQNFETVNATVLKINGYIVGYYIPNKNTWIVGNWIWHIHYITIITNYAFPEFVRLMNIPVCKNPVYATKVSNKRPKSIVSIGADPEFELVKNGKVVRADHNLDIPHADSAPIGLDGSCAQIEIRPNPGNPAKVVQNIRKLIKEFAVKYPEYDLTDSGNMFPLGGHIHVSVDNLGRIEVPEELVKVLDDFVGKPTLDVSGEARGSYKELGMIRTNNHGFEYRTPPSSIVRNPVIAFVVFKLVKNLCEKYFNSEVLEYHDVPILNDYITVGGLTSREAKKFMEFCQGGHNPEKSIRASWKVPPAPVVERTGQHSINVTFRDEWSWSVRIALLEAMSRISTEDISRTYTISFYGLSVDRGDVLTTLHGVTGIGYVTPVKPEWSSSDCLNVGVSRDLRSIGMTRIAMYDIARIVNDMIRRHQQSIITNISNEDGDNYFEV